MAWKVTQAAEIGQVGATNRRYPMDEEVRGRIAVQAYELLTREMAMAHSLSQMMELAKRVKREKRLASNAS